jgi:hypothetical protein
MYCVICLILCLFNIHIIIPVHIIDIFEKEHLDSFSIDLLCMSRI